MGEPARARILVVEDEARLLRLIESVLGSAGYEVLTATTGEQAIEAVALSAPDLVLLDLLLPGAIDGFRVCERVREFSAVPIIMLTARTREEDKLRGFQLGADDYVTKPFSARELLARVQAVLRRTLVPGASSPTVDVGDLRIDLAARRVTVAGRQVHLTPTEYRLLVALARQPGHIMEHERLLTEVWGVEYRDQVEYLRTYVRYLRQKIEPDPSRPRYLLTEPGVGYLLSAPRAEANPS
ncbi:MAG: response regulator transcription factor [Thermomicrobiaceae bacterium]|nr:response regulator transcription factor [Thermomicrobiaceae bacterium]